jgi:hypothetical protein
VGPVTLSFLSPSSESNQRHNASSSQAAGCLSQIHDVAVQRFVYAFLRRGSLPVLRRAVDLRRCGSSHHASQSRLRAPPPRKPERAPTTTAATAPDVARAPRHLPPSPSSPSPGPSPLVHGRKHADAATPLLHTPPAVSSMLGNRQQVLSSRLPCAVIMYYCHAAKIGQRNASWNLLRMELWVTLKFVERLELDSCVVWSH